MTNRQHASTHKKKEGYENVALKSCWGKKITFHYFNNNCTCKIIAGYALIFFRPFPASMHRAIHA